MSTVNQSNMTSSVPAFVRVMQIIVGAMLMGLLSFGAIATFLGTQGVDAKVVPNQAPVQQPAAGLQILVYFGAAFATISIILRIILPNLIAQSSIKALARTQPVESITRVQLAQIYQTTLIIAIALLEGAGMFNLVTVLVTKQPVGLGIAGIIMAGIALAFPTVDRVESWIDEQLRNIQANPLRAE